MKRNVRGKLLAVGVSCLFVLIGLGLGEVYCRVFTRINFLDNSSGLFVYDRYGRTYANTPNFTGVSFGETFYTDANGFRIDPNAPGLQNGDAVLIMGDSVAFGPALTEADSIAGVLRRRMPSTRIYNGAVIGYDSFDYRAATPGIIHEHPEVRSVVLFVCLNDVNDASAQLIRAQNGTGGHDPAPAGGIARWVNDSLRSRSKLYLWLKNALVDTQMNYFAADLAGYNDGANVAAALRPIADLDADLKARGIPLKVFIMPYEVQLRPGRLDDQLRPQRMINEFSAVHQIDHYDMLPKFAASGIKADRLFLYGDPMHLSVDGARVAADAVCVELEGCKN